MGQGLDYKVDIVFVIDATGSMKPIMDEVKSGALAFGDEIKRKMEDENKMISDLRFRVVDFGDFASEGEDAIRPSDFFEIPAQKTAFESHVKGIDYLNRGGDLPENALEALWVAMNSEWMEIKSGENGRHIIVLITDALPLNLQERKGTYGYNEEDFPSDINALGEAWNANAQESTIPIHPVKKRLILYAPQGTDKDGHTWEQVRGWEKVQGSNIDSGSGAFELNIENIAADIVGSI